MIPDRLRSGLGASAPDEAYQRRCSELAEAALHMCALMSCDTGRSFARHRGQPDLYVEDFEQAMKHHVMALSADSHRGVEQHAAVLRSGGLPANPVAAARALGYACLHLAHASPPGSRPSTCECALCASVRRDACAWGEWAPAAAVDLVLKDIVDETLAGG